MDGSRLTHRDLIDPATFALNEMKNFFQGKEQNMEC